MHPGPIGPSSRTARGTPDNEPAMPPLEIMSTSRKPGRKVPLRNRLKHFWGGSSNELDPVSATTRQQENEVTNVESDPRPTISSATPKALELKGLWKLALDQLRKNDSELVDAYGSALSQELEDVKLMFGFTQNTGGRYFAPDPSEYYTAAELKQATALALGRSPSEQGLSTVERWFQTYITQ